MIGSIIYNLIFVKYSSTRQTHLSQNKKSVERGLWAVLKPASQVMIFFFISASFAGQSILGPQQFASNLWQKKSNSKRTQLLCRMPCRVHWRKPAHITLARHLHSTAACAEWAEFVRRHVRWLKRKWVLWRWFSNKALGTDGEVDTRFLFALIQLTFGSPITPQPRVYRVHRTLRNVDRLDHRLGYRCTHSHACHFGSVTLSLGRINLKTKA